MNHFKMNRRMFLTTTGMAAGAALIGTKPSFAETKDVVVGTWGGDYERLLKEYVAPIAAENGANFVADVGNAPGRMTKLIAQARRPVNSMDIACLSNENMAQMAARDVLAEVDEKTVPNLAHVFPQFRKPYCIPHIYSGLVIVYNPEVVAKPSSYADLWKPEYAGKLGFSDILYFFMIIAAAQAHGGKPDDFEPAKKALMELKDKVKVYPSNEAVANALHTGDIGVTIMWKSRAVQWGKNGVPAEAVTPAEGAIPVVFEASMTKNANNPEGAAAVLNAMLDPQAQLGFAEAMGYLPTVDNADVPKELREKLGFTDEERENFFNPDSTYMMKTTSDWLNWWKQDFQG